MHPQDCPNWEYQNHRNNQEILKREVRSILIDLRRGNIDNLGIVTDSRSVHLRLFRDLTPAECPYYAGHYRGEKFRCLEYLSVGIQGDPRVGYAAYLVPGHMAELAKLIQASIAGLDEGFSLPSAQISLRYKILYAVVIACRIFELLLTIHPYVNGNGHIGRFCIWVILGRYDIWPERWPIEPRPADPPYTDLIIKYRNGDREPLEKFILQCLSKNN